MSDVGEEVEVKKQSRRRGRVLEQAILDAAWAELSECGWDEFTIDGVAVRSGIAKEIGEGVPERTLPVPSALARKLRWAGTGESAAGSRPTRARARLSHTSRSKPSAASGR